MLKYLRLKIAIFGVFWSSRLGDVAVSLIEYVTWSILVLKIYKIVGGVNIIITIKTTLKIIID